ncbi:hypothetical protein F4815DRAFT_243933 [Daldinia loculata]|nr:hypothetical protein F4815DRAFT_243933 [Daldinia loculata]
MGVFALDSFIDFCLVVLPIPFVWGLQLDLKRKIAVTIVFIVGGFAFVAGLNNTIIQLVSLTEPELLTATGGGSNFFQGSSLLFSNWPTIEIGVGLLASNLPHLSFRVGHALKNNLPHALRIPFESIRHAAGALSSSSLHQRREKRSGRLSEYPGSQQTLWLGGGASGNAKIMEGTKGVEQISERSLEIYEMRDLSVNVTSNGT